MGCFNSSTVLRYATDDDSYIDNTWNIIDYYKLRHKANAIMVKKENTALILKLTPLYQVFEIRTCSSKISF